MATPAFENTILDALLVRAQAITGGPTYNTNPAIKQRGLPFNAIGEGDGEAIYLVHARTDPEPAGTKAHAYRIVLQAWIVADTEAEVLNVKKDLLDAVQADEPALYAVANYGFTEGGCLPPEPEVAARIGKHCRVQEFFASVGTAHA